MTEENYAQRGIERCLAKTCPSIKGRPKHARFVKLVNAAYEATHHQEESKKSLEPLYDMRLKLTYSEMQQLQKLFELSNQNQDLLGCL